MKTGALPRESRVACKNSSAHPHWGEGGQNLIGSEMFEGLNIRLENCWPLIDMESNSISQGIRHGFQEQQKNRFKSGAERPFWMTWSVPSASFVRTSSSRFGQVILATGMDTHQAWEYWPRKLFRCGRRKQVPRTGTGRPRAMESSKALHSSVESDESSLSSIRGNMFSSDLHFRRSQRWDTVSP